MKSLKALEIEVEAIKARNRRVEADKAWEVSITRRISISVSTYILIAIFMFVLEVENPFVSAIIPAVAYLISTLTIGVLKSRWLRKRNKNL